jgi:hypothetical protein
MTFHSTLKIIAFGFFLTPFSAVADNVGVTMDCSAVINGVTVEAIATPLAGGKFTTKLIANGTEIPGLSGGCTVSTRPGTKYVLCSYLLSQMRLEVYPVAYTTNGKQKFMQYVAWNGNEPHFGRFSNCIE